MHRIAITILAVSCLVLAAPPPPNLIGIYQAHADPALPPLPAGFVYEVSAFTFSPDEQWLAVAIHALPPDPHVTRIPDGTLLLLPLDPAQGRRVEIDAGAHGSALWSPDSQSVLVHPSYGAHVAARMYNLRGEPIWTGPPSGPFLGFLAPGRLLTRNVEANGTQGGFDTIDTRTSSVARWAVPRSWVFRAIDTDRGLLAVFPNRESSKTLIVDAATGKTVQSMKNQNQPDFTNSSMIMGVFDGVYFAEDGRTLCDVARIAPFKSHPLCRDIATGKMIAEFRGFEGGQPADAGIRGSRMVLTNLNYLPGGGFGKHSGGAESDAGRVVWDFRAGKEVAAWEPSMRETGWLRGPFAGSRELSGPVAISPSGNYVAESLGDELHIYRIP